MSRANTRIRPGIPCRSAAARFVPVHTVAGMRGTASRRDRCAIEWGSARSRLKRTVPRWACTAAAWPAETTQIVCDFSAAVARLSLGGSNRESVTADSESDAPVGDAGRAADGCPRSNPGRRLSLGRPRRVLALSLPARVAAHRAVARIALRCPCRSGL